MMDFEEFWNRLSAELTTLTPFTTMAYGNEFEAVMDGYYAVGVIPSSTKYRRNVDVKHFQHVWDVMRGADKGTRYVNIGGRYSESFHASYICALIKYVVGNQNM